MNLREYGKHKRELAAIQRRLEKLQDLLGRVPIIHGKVQASLTDYPYTPAHIDVEMQEPGPASSIKDRIAELEKREAVLLEEMEKGAAYIYSLPEGLERQVLEMVYLDGMTQEAVADALGYTQGRIAQIVSKCVKACTII